MKLTPTPISGLMIAETAAHSDNRGHFRRVFCAPSLKEQGVDFAPVQANMSYSARRGTLRGLHYQTGDAPEAKVFRCLRGAVYDMTVDLRRGSPTFLKWFGIELSAENARALVIPPGFAHGFLTLADDTEVLYLTSHAYSPAHEGALRFDDPRVGMQWPFAPVVMSDRDRAIPDLPATFDGVDIP
jgi:dTDP-4-dehydrorhamnose 3,5-epimerase